MQALVEHYGVERLRDRFARMGAFTSGAGSTRRPRSPIGSTASRAACAARPCRRSPSRRCGARCSQAKLGEDGEKRLEELAEQGERLPRPGRAGRRGQGGGARPGARRLPRGARRRSRAPRWRALDMLLKAVPAVAERLRAGRAGGADGIVTAGSVLVPEERVPVAAERRPRRRRRRLGRHGGGRHRRARSGSAPSLVEEIAVPRRHVDGRLRRHVLRLLLPRARRRPRAAGRRLRGRGDGPARRARALLRAGAVQDDRRRALRAVGR